MCKLTIFVYAQRSLFLFVIDVVANNVNSAQYMYMYLSQCVHTYLQPDNYEAQVIEVHKAKAGYTPAQAESEFLSIAKGLPRYGEHFFLAKVRNEKSCVSKL